MYEIQKDEGWGKGATDKRSTHLEKYLKGKKSSNQSLLSPNKKRQEDSKGSYGKTE